MLEKVELPQQYKTGHEGVDEQHAHLFSILLGIVNIIKNEKNAPQKNIEADVHELLTELQKYTQNHFQYEERIMEKMKYPEFEIHRGIHQGFIKKMIEIQKKAIRRHETKLSLIHDMAVFVKEWYMNHVLIEDKKMITVFMEIESKKVAAT